jgi:hypothetical protein
MVDLLEVMSSQLQTPYLLGLALHSKRYVPLLGAPIGETSDPAAKHTWTVGGYSVPEFRPPHVHAYLTSGWKKPRKEAAQKMGGV